MKKYFKNGIYLIFIISIFFAIPIISVDAYSCGNGDNCTITPDGTEVTVDSSLYSKNTLRDQLNLLNGSGYSYEAGSSPIKITQGISPNDSITESDGLYIKLIKYNPSNKTETIVGTPILIYGRKLLDSFTQSNNGGSITSLGGPNSSTNPTVCMWPICTADGKDRRTGEKMGDYPMNPFEMAELKKQGIEFTPSEKGDGTGKINVVKGKDGKWYAAANCTNSSSSVYGPESIFYYEKKDIRFLINSGFSDYANEDSFRKASISMSDAEKGNGLRLFSGGTLRSSRDGTLYSYIQELLGAVDARNSNSYLFRNNAGFSTSVAFTSFKLNASEINDATLNADNYYISIEPVIRERTNYAEDMWSTSQTSTSSSGTAEFKWTSKCGSRYGFEHPGRCEYTCTKQKLDTCYNPDTRKDETCWTDYDATCYDTWSGSCTSYKNYNTTTLVTLHTRAISVIYPVRYSTLNVKIGSLTTSRLEPRTAHQVLIDDKNGGNKETGVYEYFIGPTLKDSIVGQARLDMQNNKYSLFDGNSHATNYYNKDNAKSIALGVSYWWLPDLTNCKRECTNPNDLRCIENYCDNSIGYDERANTQKLKAKCILSTCGYSYTRVNCATANPYRGMQSPNLDIEETSTCSNLNSGLGNTIDNGKTLVTCESDPVGANGNPLNEIFDQKTYINVACKEKTSIGFKDISQDKILPGAGIEYYTVQLGNKECTVFWDLESFKFAYASYHSEDMIELANKSEISARSQLINMLNYFNSAQSRSINSAIGIDLEGTDYKYTWNDLKYKKVLNDNAKVTEVIYNEKKESDNYELVKTYEEESSKLDIVENQNVTIYNALNSSRLNINKYLNNSDAKNTYTFDKYCTSGYDAKVYKTDGSGVCYKDVNGNDVLGRNVYYTSINATPDSKITLSGIKPNVTTTISDENGKVLYSDSCPYSVEDELKCVIDITASETNKHGNSIYVGSVTADLLVIDKQGLKDNVISTNITAGSKTDERTITVDINDQRNGNEQVKIIGTIETQNGKKITCSKNIHIIDPSPYCGVSCDVRSVNTLGLYEIISTGIQTPRSYQSATSNNFTFVRVVPDVRDLKYYVRNSRTNPSRYVYGKVEGSMTNNGSTCYNLCWNGTPTTNNCPVLYKPADLTGIKEYCINNWDKDINDYESVEECQIRCKRKSCPSDVRNYTSVENYCNNYEELGYKSKNNCINYCYYCPECTDEYTYRPVNNNNPFPDGTRTTQGKIDNKLIGLNWISKEEYITDDNDDLTSVTGVYANQTPEYVIDLDKEAIKNIRNYVMNYNESRTDANAYLDYVYASNTNQNGRYYSAFIRSNGINQYFKMIDGKAN